METITTTGMIASIVDYLGNRLSKDNSINQFIFEFSEATINWLKPLFLKEDGTEKEIIKNLKEKPESKARKKAVESALEIGVEDSSEASVHVNEIFEKVSKANKETSIANSKNVNTGTVNTNGGDFHLGDNFFENLEKVNDSKIKGDNNIIIQDAKESNISIMKDKIMK